jgi:carboxyl-terminal processing protease
MKRFQTILLLLAMTAGLSVHADDTVPLPAQNPQQPLPEIRLDDDACQEMITFLYGLSLLRTHYVDGSKTNYRDMFRSALRGVMQDLDRFSNFETPQSFEETQKDFSAQFGGIGVTLSTRNGLLEIVGVTEDGPADKAGIKAGDVIVKIDGKDLNKLKLSDCVGMLRGDIGTTVELSVRRAGVKDELSMHVVRGTVEVPSVVGAHILPDSGGIGYLRILQFARDTPGRLDTALSRLSSEGMTSLVIDLRNNPGGIVDSAVEVCSRFVKEDQTLVTLEWRDPSKNQTYKTVPCTKYYNLPLILLVNGNSASAAELSASALRDMKRVVVLGEKTFGKGSAQNIMPIGDLGALRITVAHYFTPSHTPIHGKGLQPDITVEIPPQRAQAFNAQLNDYPGVIDPGLADGVRDIQLERAVEILRSASILESVKDSGPSPENSSTTRK